MVISQSENFSNMISERHIFWGSAAPIHPVLKISKSHRMCYRNLRNGHVHRVQTLGDSRRPIVAAYRRKSQRNSLVKR